MATDTTIISCLRSVLAAHISLFPSTSEVNDSPDIRSSYESQEYEKVPSTSLQGGHFTPSNPISQKAVLTIHQQIGACLSSPKQPTFFSMTAKSFVIDTGASMTITNSLDDF